MLEVIRLPMSSNLNSERFLLQDRFFKHSLPRHSQPYAKPIFMLSFTDESLEVGFPAE